MEQPLLSNPQPINSNTDKLNWVEKEPTTSGKDADSNPRRQRKNTENKNGSSKAGSNDQAFDPTALVIKNIHASVKREILMDILEHMGLPAPFALNYHLDNGVFRGLAFANFHTSEEAAKVISSLRGVEISGRKLQVEFKKSGGLDRRDKPAENSNPHSASHRVGNREQTLEPNGAGLDFTDLQTRVFYEQVSSFYKDASRAALIYPPTLDSVQRKLIHQISERFGLYHYSSGTGSERHIRVSKTKPSPTPTISSKKPAFRRTAIPNSAEEGNASELTERPSTFKPFKRAPKASDSLAVYPIRQPLIPNLDNNFASRKGEVKSKAAIVVEAWNQLRYPAFSSCMVVFW